MFWSALIMGLTGSLHCAGMCSPLVLAATTNGKGMRDRVIYNLGRVSMYALLGALLGTIGAWMPFDAFRSSLTIALGLGLVVLSIGGFSTVRIPIIHTLLSRVLITFKRIFATLLRQRSPRTIFLLGFLNGMLPCGLTFAALIVALTLGTWQSALFMIVFGLGTFPVMVGLASGLTYLIKRFNFSLARLASVLLFISGCLLITRAFVHPESHRTMSHKQDIVDVVLCR